jgi:hypothetical protein
VSFSFLSPLLGRCGSTHVPEESEWAVHGIERFRPLPLLLLVGSVELLLLYAAVLLAKVGEQLRLRYALSELLSGETGLARSCLRERALLSAAAREACLDGSADVRLIRTEGLPADPQEVLHCSGSALHLTTDPTLLARKLVLDDRDHRAGVPSRDGVRHSGRSTKASERRLILDQRQLALSERPASRLIARAGLNVRACDLLASLLHQLIT